jgi:DUF4097 and DUF4098 domain-containing protein YvlB
MANWEFPGSDPIDVDINLAAGSISVSAEPIDVIKVSLLPSRPDSRGDAALARIRVEYDDGRLVIAEPQQGLLRRSASFDLAVVAPAGSRCSVRTAASDVRCDGQLGLLDVRTASGDVHAATVTGEALVHTASGDARLGNVAAEVRIHTGTGDVSVRHAGGAADVNTASGDVEIGSAAASVTARSASGDIKIASMSAGHADLNSVSGDVFVAVVPGIGVYLDLGSLSGNVCNELGQSDAAGPTDLQIKARTVSGDLRVARTVLATDAS